MAVGWPRCVPGKSSAYSLSHHVRRCSARNSSKGVHVDLGKNVIDQGGTERTRISAGELCLEILHCFLIEWLLCLSRCSFSGTLLGSSGIEERFAKIFGRFLRDSTDDGGALRIEEARIVCGRNPSECPRDGAVLGEVPKGGTEALNRQDPVLLRDCAGKPAADTHLPNDPREATREPSTVSLKPGKKARRPRGKSTCERLRELHASDPDFAETASLEDIGIRIDRKRGTFDGSAYYLNKLRPMRDELKARKKKVNNPQKWHDCSEIDDRGHFESGGSPENDRR